jgi:hypothetical protein
MTDGEVPMHRTPVGTLAQSAKRRRPPADALAVRMARVRPPRNVGVIVPPYTRPMKGDRVEIVVDTGNGVQTFEIGATRAGRRVDISVSRGVVEVSEVTRGGTPIRTGRFMATRIVAMVEHPAAEERGAS